MNRKPHKQAMFIFLTMLVLFTGLPVIAQDATPVPENTLIGTAYINNFFIIEVDGLSVAVTGELGDSCTTLGDITQTIVDQTIMIVIETTRPADAFCAMVIEMFNITIPLQIDDLPAGDYTVDVNGVTVGFTLGANSPGVVDAQTVPETVLSVCPEADANLSAFASDDGFYCFLYPADYDVEVLDALNMVVSTPITSASGASLLITMQPRQTLTLVDIANDRQLSAPDVTMNFEAQVIGGVDALVTEDIPGPVKSRHAFIALELIVLTIQVQPTDGIDTDAVALANELWTTVIESMTFPMDMPAEVLECASVTETASLFEGEGFCFLYPQEALIVNNATIAFLSLPTETQARDLTLIIERVPDADSLTQIARDLQADYDEPIQLRPTIINGLSGFIVESVPNQPDTRQAYIVYKGILVQLILQPFDDPVAENLWQMVTNSLVIGR